MTDELQVSRDDDILRITFDRPDALNALSAGMVQGATEAVERCEERAIVLTGTGRAFCAGADVSGISPAGVAELVDAANGLIRAVVSSPKPVVAAVNGPAAGVGCSIALACDFTIAQESAYFLLSFADIGLMPDGGSTEIVAASIGRARAMTMGILAERIGAYEAERIGLIHAAHDDDSYVSAVDELSGRLAAGPTLSYGRTKAAINASTLRDLEAAFARERDGQIAMLQSADATEGIAAFMQKRAPRFCGK